MKKLINLSLISILTVIIFISSVNTAFAFDIGNLIKKFSSDNTSIRKVIFKDNDDFISENKTERIKIRDNLRIETNVTDINIIHSNKPELEYIFSLKVIASEWQNDRPSVIYYPQYNKLEIKWPSVLKSEIIKIESSIKIYIPENITQLDIRTASGNIFSGEIKINKFKSKSASGNINVKKAITKEFLLKCTSGNITSENIESEISEINNVSGNIEIKSITSEKLSVTTVSGNINTFQSSKKADFKTVSGNMLVKLGNSIENNTVFDSVSGDIIISTSTTDNVSAVFSTISGNISISSHFRNISEKSGKKIIEAAEKKNLITIKASSVSGNIQIR